MDDASRAEPKFDTEVSSPALCDPFAAKGFDPAVADLPAPSSFVVHSHLRWDFVWQRPQQLLSRLAPQSPVLFIEEPLATDSEPHLAITEPQPNVVRVVPHVAPHISTADAQSLETLRLLQPALASHPLLAGRFQRPVQWFYSPMPAPVMLGRFDASCVVYDCMDELANFRFAPADIVVRERLLLTKAHVVFTGGYQLYASKSRHHRNVHFYGCGVDAKHFARARHADTQPPKELAALPRPVLGYYGVIDERLDYELIASLGDALPAASIVMVGPLAKVDAATLPQRTNLHWLGQRRYDELPAIVKAFDVCLMPFALNEATQYINPTKTLEYMAAGKPIVSTAVPDVVRNFTPIVEIARSHAEFISAIECAWSQPNQDRLQQGIECANAATWEAIVAAMRRHIAEASSPH
ncbi:MAG: glycosyltransferase [Gammaproteobacteria bacterium]